MGKASELIDGASENPIVEGSFECHVCGECVDEAEHIPAKKELRWVCDSGHASKIEVQW